MTGFVTACWLVTVGMAELLINWPAGSAPLFDHAGPIFGITALVVVAAAVAFVFVGKQFERTQAKSGRGRRDLSQSPGGRMTRFKSLDADRRRAATSGSTALPSATTACGCRRRTTGRSASGRCAAACATASI